MLCCGSSRTGISGRVRGPDERDYLYSIDTIGVTESKLNLHFTMKEMPGLAPALNQAPLSDSARLEHSRQLYEAIRERDEAEVQLRSAKQKHEVGVISTPELEAATLRFQRAEQRTQDLQRIGGGRAGGSGRNIMDSTFSIALGETVVIGTSRLMGDQALIALLTAAAKPGTSR
jgi:hypothetical protein